MEKDSGKPDENQIAALLEKFQPHPSSRFYQHTEAAPWQKQKRQLRDGLPSIGMLTPRFKMRAIALSIIILLVIATGIFAAPNFEAIAQQIAQYFLPAESDQITVPLIISPITMMPGSPEHFSLSLSEAQDIAVFTLREIPLPFRGLIFTGAHHEPDLHVVTLRYEGDGFILLLSQRLLGEVEEYSSIGASAPVEVVPVRGVTGEYVAGGWRVVSDSEIPDITAIPGTEVNLGLIWDPELLQSTLRWQEDDIAFEVLINGSHNLEKSDLINTAERVK